MIELTGRWPSPSTPRIMSCSSGLNNSPKAACSAITSTVSPSGCSPTLPPSKRSTASEVRSRRFPETTSCSRLRRPIWLNASISTEKPMAA